MVSYKNHLCLLWTSTGTYIIARLTVGCVVRLAITLKRFTTCWCLCYLKGNTHLHTLCYGWFMGSDTWRNKAWIITTQNIVPNYLCCINNICVVYEYIYIGIHTPVKWYLSRDYCVNLLKQVTGRRIYIETIETWKGAQGAYICWTMSWPFTAL